MKKLIYIFCIILASINNLSAGAQGVIEVAPLFEYPVAPDELESINDKCNYLVKNFWNNFNFKAKEPVDQYALNEAFQVYVTTFQFASEKEVEQSVDKLIKNISGNKILMLQFCKAAEENLYGPRADFWSDELYLKFLDAVIKDKKVPESRKTKYKTQASAIRSSAVGQTAPIFWFVDKERASKRYFPMSTPTLLIFGNPADTDWRLKRIRVESNFKLSEALDKGRVNIIYIVPGNIEDWQINTDNYNPHWTVGQSDEVLTLYDLRLQPSIFLVGSDGKIIKKNLSIEDAVEELLNL